MAAMRAVPFGIALKLDPSDQAAAFVLAIEFEVEIVSSIADLCSGASGAVLTRLALLLHLLRAEIVGPWIHVHYALPRTVSQVSLERQNAILNRRVSVVREDIVQRCIKQHRMVANFFTMKL